MARVSRRSMGRAAGVLMSLVCLSVVQGRPAAAAHDGSHDFDFGIGTFRTHIRRLQHPLTGSSAWSEWSGIVDTRRIWDAGGNLEQLDVDTGSGRFQGLTLRLFNAKTQQWNLYWVDSDDGVMGTPMVGRFEQGRGVFYDKETIDGRAVRVRDIYSQATADSYHFEEAFSPDDGKTWETNFIADLKRVAPADAQAAALPDAKEPAAQHDFDWQFGNWRIHMARLKDPLADSHTWTPLDGSVVVDKVWGGRANLAVIDTQGPSGRLQFLSLRLYNPKTHRWSLNFATRDAGVLGVPMVGEFKGDTGMFYSNEQVRGRPVLCRFVFSRSGTLPVSEEQAFSTDGGKTWEVNWINTSSR